MSSLSLAIIDTVNPHDAIKVLNHCIEISMPYIHFATVILFSDSLPENIDDKYTNHIRYINIPKITSSQDYSKFCIRNLDENIWDDYVLLVQRDGFILNPQLWDTGRFTKYDYIGSPWPADYCNDVNLNEAAKKNFNRVGNGGFSLRSKKLLTACRWCPFDDIITEDAYICNNHRDWFEEKGIKFAPLDVAEKFSQDPLVNPYSTFGFHGNREVINRI